MVMEEEEEKEGSYRPSRSLNLTKRRENNV